MGVYNPPPKSTLVKHIEIDFGPLPIDMETFTISDTDVTVSSLVIPSTSSSAPTDKDADELEMDTLLYFVTPLSGQFLLRATPVEQNLVADKFKVDYLVSN